MKIGPIVYAYLGGAFTCLGVVLLLNGLTGKETITLGVLAVACSVLSVLEQRHVRKRG